MQLDVYKKDGTLSGEKVALAPEIFEITPNDHAIYQAVTTYLANQRQGTHKTKTYGEVAGSGKKLWKQKHTGRARIGAVRSPLWKGGGTIFGPVPRDYSNQLPKKVKMLARKSALTYKAKDAAICVVEDFDFESPRTKEMAAVLNALKLTDKKALLLVGKSETNVWKSGRNIPKLKVLEAVKASTYDILNSKILVLQKSALEVLEKQFQ
ncbi:MAG: 50S ribosomal protein L4 [Ignavibacteriales bacterium]|nr:50S ribosomal protein L4 [Ignavibacteriales bacterium]